MLIIQMLFTTLCSREVQHVQQKRSVPLERLHTVTAQSSSDHVKLTQSALTRAAVFVAGGEEATENTATVSTGRCCVDVRRRRLRRERRLRSAMTAVFVVRRRFLVGNDFPIRGEGTFDPYLYSAAVLTNNGNDR